MDTMKFLLGATAALLFGAIVVSWKGMKQGVANAPQEELNQLKQQIADLRKEVKESQKLKESQQQVSAPKVEDLEQKQKLADALAQIEKDKAARDAELNAERDAKLKRDEEGLIAQKMLEKDDDELKRARWISDALVMGKVKEYINDPEVGQYIIIDVLRPEEVQVGNILGIRRKTGILARYKVSSVSPDGAVADPLPGFGSATPEPGDELIVPPRY